LKSAPIGITAQGFSRREREIASEPADLFSREAAGCKPVAAPPQSDYRIRKRKIRSLVPSNRKLGGRQGKHGTRAIPIQDDNARRHIGGVVYTNPSRREKLCTPTAKFAAAQKTFLRRGKLCGVSAHLHAAAAKFFTPLQIFRKRRKRARCVEQLFSRSRWLMLTIPV
jgi:hypothetical protein